MGSSSETSNKSIDASVGGLVWVRRRNGSWWPGRIMGPDELPEGSAASPRSGTPVRLLGRDDASVDWYNLERSKRVKAFRCGDYDECIEKAKANAASGNKKAVKYARREDAIIHALEIENARLGKYSLNFSARMSNSGGDHSSARESPATSLSGEVNEDMVDDVSDSEDCSDSAPELSQSVISFEEPNHISSAKLQTVQGRRRTPNDSEDDGTEGVKRMRGLEDLGMGAVSKRSVQTGGLLELVQQDSASLLDLNARNGMLNGSPVNGSKSTSSLKRKRSQVANVNELLKRRNRSRPLTKVLESTAMVSIPVTSDQVPNSCGSPLQGLSDVRVSGLESNESKGSLSVDPTGISENGVCINDPEPAFGAPCNNDKMKENEIPSVSGLAENDSSDRLFDVPFIGDEKDPSGSSPILASCSSGKPQICALGRQSSQSSQAKAVSLGDERTNESGSTSSAALHDIGQSIEKGSSKWQSKGKRNLRQTSKDRKHDSRRYMDVDEESNAYSAGIEHSGRFSQDSDQKVNCNAIHGSGAYSYTFLAKSKQASELADGPTPRSLPYRQSRFTVPARYQTSESTALNVCSDGTLYDVKVEVKSNYRPQHVPLVSLMSKLNGKAIIGHPLTVEALGDDCSDILLSRLECDWEVGKMGYAVKPKPEMGSIPAKCVAAQSQNSPSRSPKAKKSGLQQKKIRKLSSLTGHNQSEEAKPLATKSQSPVIACIPLKVVFCRIKEAVNGSARPTHRVLRSSET